MSISCGSKCVCCDYPIHFDTYRGCSHACKYCFVKRKYAIDTVEPDNCVKSLRNFINGKRKADTKWCDWDIPLQWGATSDPFQPCEAEHQISRQCLEVFNETQYPFMVLTKNPVMLLQEPYKSLISSCNCVLQVSAACSKYDRLETGAVTFEQRLQAIKELSPIVKRVVVRLSPYFPDCHKDIIKQIPRFADAGVHSVIVSAYFSSVKQKGMKRYGSLYMFDLDILYPKFIEIRDLCYKHNMKFYASEEGLEHIGDGLTCCGTDGLEGFIPNTYNTAHIALDDVEPTPTDAMKRTDTFQPFKCIGQSQVWANKCKGKSFADLMAEVDGHRIEYLREMRDKYNG